MVSLGKGIKSNYKAAAHSAKGANRGVTECFTASCTRINHVESAVIPRLTVCLGCVRLQCTILSVRSTPSGPYFNRGDHPPICYILQSEGTE